jgi:protein-tyrosine phosphatase
VLTGAEIAMTRAADLAPEELNAMALAGGGWLLIESPFSPVATGLQALVGTLQDQGYRILLAHPERCPAFHRDPDILRSLSRTGALSSITAGSLVGRFGSTVRRFAFELIAAGLAHNVASDAHDCVQRHPGGLAELEQSGLSPLADWLTRDVPAAILTDRPIPPRPAVTLEHASWKPRRRWPSRS